MSSFLKPIKPVPFKKDNESYPSITEEYCCKLSEYQGHYSNPKHIGALYLHFTGFGKIENLDNFTNLKTLYLENNCLTKIENLDNLKELFCLYLMNNFINNISGLENNLNIRILNLESNKITKIENLSHLPYLQTLTLDKNLIEKVENLLELTKMNSLEILGLSNNIINEDYIINSSEIKNINLDSIIQDNNNYNNIDNKENKNIHIKTTNKFSSKDLFIEIMKNVPKLKVLYFKGNELIRKIPNYRKIMIKEIKSLSYLDDLPVDEGERLATLAFFEGGLELERKVKLEYRLKRDFGNRIREYERFKNNNKPSKEVIEERKKNSLESLRNEYLYKKNMYQTSKINLLKQYEIASSLKNTTMKNNLIRELESVDNQIKENERFKEEEQNNPIEILVKRGDHKVKKLKEMSRNDFEDLSFSGRIKRREDEFATAAAANNNDVGNCIKIKEDISNNDYYSNVLEETTLDNVNDNTYGHCFDTSNMFVFEDWMNSVFEYYLFINMWDFEKAVNCFKFEYKEKINNIELLTERDLRIRLANIENNYLNNCKYESENNYINQEYKKEIEYLINNNNKNDISKDTVNTGAIIKIEEINCNKDFDKETNFNSSNNGINFEELD